MTPQHHDEAVAEALDQVDGWLVDAPAGRRVLVVDDLIGRISVVVWQGSQGIKKVVLQRLRSAMEALGDFFTGTLEVVSDPSSPWNSLWDEAPACPGHARRRVLVRVGDHLHWFGRPGPLPSPTDTTKVVAFLSFKGGVGRSTALASFAIQRARAGDHVVVVDLDLDAPGIGTLLQPDSPEDRPEFGVVDFILDVHWAKDLDLNDYLHRCARPAVTDRGKLQVMSAGRLDDRYLGKLARADLDASLESAVGHRVELLLKRVKALKPDWILLDGRAGLSTTGGLLLNGLAHLYVLVATASAQSYFGLTCFAHQLGARRLQSTPSQIQSDCFVVHAMIPDNAAVAELARTRFESESEAIFRDHYFAAQTSDIDSWWSLADLDDENAPHKPVNLSYQGKLAFFDSIDQVADTLATSPEYVQLDARIVRHLPPRDEDSNDETLDE